MDKSKKKWDKNLSLLSVKKKSVCITRVNLEVREKKNDNLGIKGALGVKKTRKWG